MHEQFEYFLNGRVHGPITRVELTGLIASGELGESLKVRPFGEAKWQRAKDVFAAPPEPPEQKDAQPTGDSLTAETGWYYKVHGYTVGPVPRERLESRVENGLLQYGMEVREGRDGEWVLTEDVEFLKLPLSRAPLPKVSIAPRYKGLADSRRTRRMVLLITLAAVVIFFIVTPLVTGSEDGVQAKTDAFSVTFPGAYTEYTDKAGADGLVTLSGVEFRYTFMQYDDAPAGYVAVHARAQSSGAAQTILNVREELQIAILQRDWLETGVTPDRMHLSYDARVQDHTALQAEYTIDVSGIKAKEQIIWLAADEFLFIGQKGLEIDDDFFISVEI